jgi:hypothetical protein
VAEVLDTPEGKLLQLSYNGTTLEDYSRPCREYNIKSRSTLECTWTRHKSAKQMKNSWDLPLDAKNIPRVTQNLRTTEAALSTSNASRQDLSSGHSSTQRKSRDNTKSHAMEAMGSYNLSSSRSPQSQATIDGTARNATKGKERWMPQPSSFTETTLDTKPTTTSLRWKPHSRILELYKFVVGEGASDSYFQLIDGFAITELTPARVFLDSPKYSYPVNF